MSIKTVLFFLYVLRTVVNMADGSQHYYEETGTYILVFFFLRLYCSSMLDSVTEYAAALNLYHLC